MRSPLTRDVALFDVVVEAHEVRVGPSRTMKVPASETRIGGRYTEDAAKLQVLRWAQTDAGVPPWRTCRREGWPHVKATEHVVEVG